jgi:hypothetical protein
MRDQGLPQFPQNRQNRIKRCGAMARRLEYLPHHDLPDAGGEFPRISTAKGEQLCVQNFWQ